MPGRQVKTMVRDVFIDRAYNQMVATKGKKEYHVGSEIRRKKDETINNYFDRVMLEPILDSLMFWQNPHQSSTYQKRYWKMGGYGAK